MKKILVFLLTLLICTLFFVGCTKKTEVSDQHIESKLNELSDEELQEIIEITQIEESKALAGQAFITALNIQGVSYPTRRTYLIAKRILNERQSLQIHKNDTLSNYTNQTPYENDTYNNNTSDFYNDTYNNNTSDFYNDTYNNNTSDFYNDTYNNNTSDFYNDTYNNNTSDFYNDTYNNNTSDLYNDTDESNQQQPSK